MRSLAATAERNGLRIAIYPHIGDWTERFEDAVQVARLVDRKNFGVTFNLCHTLAAGDEDRIPALLEEAGPSLFAVTINGADAGVKGPQWNRLIQTLDRGSYDVGIVLRTLKRHGLSGPDRPSGLWPHGRPPRQPRPVDRRVEEAFGHSLADSAGSELLTSRPVEEPGPQA